MRLSLKIALAILSMAAILSAGMFYSMTAARNIERTYARVADYTLPMVQALEVLRYRALRRGKKRNRDGPCRHRRRGLELLGGV